MNFGKQLGLFAVTEIIRPKIRYGGLCTEVRIRYEWREIHGHLSRCCDPFFTYDHSPLAHNCNDSSPVRCLHSYQEALLHYEWHQNTTVPYSQWNLACRKIGVWRKSNICIPVLHKRSHLTLEPSNRTPFRDPTTCTLYQVSCLRYRKIELRLSSRLPSENVVLPILSRRSMCKASSTVAYSCVSLNVCFSTSHDAKQSESCSCFHFAYRLVAYAHFGCVVLCLVRGYKGL